MAVFRNLSLIVAVLCWGMAAIAAVPTAHGIGALVLLAVLLALLRWLARREGRQLS